MSHNRAQATKGLLEVERVKSLRSLSVSHRICLLRLVPNCGNALFELSVKKYSSGWHVVRSQLRKRERNSDHALGPKFQIVLELAKNRRIAALVFPKIRLGTVGQVEISSSASRPFNFSRATSQFQTRLISRPLE